MLIFDSGIGGISVLKSIKKYLPNIHYIYVLDNEGFPYGEKNESFIIERSIKIIDKITQIYPIQIVIIACNTVSTISLSILKKIFNIPIIGTLPALKKATKITKNNVIGLIATKATIKSLYIQKDISQYINHHDINIIATNKLAKIAEEKIRKISISNIEVKKIFNSWLSLSVQPDTVCLGCTHFSFLKNEIQDIFYKSIYFVDSYEIITKKIVKYFLKNNQNINSNIFLYSKNNDELNKLLWIVKKYKFHYINKINLN